MTYILLLFALLAATPVIARQDPDTLLSELELESLDEQTRRPDRTEGSHAISALSPAFAFRSRIESVTSTPAGYGTGTYRGSPLHSYQRLLCRIGANVRGGVLIEKDPGEQSPADFLAYSVSADSVGPCARIVLGDFQLQAGQGVALSSGYGYAKGPDVEHPLFRTEHAIRPFVSSDEQHYLSGAGFELPIASTAVSLFYSSRAYGATLDEEGRVVGFMSSGLFQTETAEAKRDNLTEQLFGGRVTWAKGGVLAAGTTLLHATYSRDIADLPGQDTSHDWTTASIDFGADFSPLRIRGELTSSRGLLGGMSAMSIAPAPRCAVVAAWRYYPYGYWNFHGSGFSDGDDASNERGLYCAVTCSPSPTMHVVCSYDQLATVVPEARSFFLRGASEFLASIACVPFRRTSLEFQWRSRSDEHAAGGTLTRELARVKARYRIGNEINAELVVARSAQRRPSGSENEKGRLVRASVRIVPAGGFRCDLGLTLFHTDSYATRISASEPALDGTIDLPMLYGSGARWSAMVRREIFHVAAITIKYSDIVRADVRRIGAGATELPGNYQGWFSAQCDASW